MILVSHDFKDGQKIPEKLAFCIPDIHHHVCLGKNQNPHLTWNQVPEGTLSFALICHDPDAPSRGDDVNQKDRTVPASLPRVDFFHWVLANIPADLREIGTGEFSTEVTPKGKPGPYTLYGGLHGINSYTDWFAGDNDMRGDYYGYDGPCPPWNDERVHRYIFTLYALNIAQQPLTGKFSGPQLLAAIQEHILAQASLTGTYSLSPATA